MIVVIVKLQCLHPWLDVKINMSGFKEYIVKRSFLSVSRSSEILL